MTLLREMANAVRFLSIDSVEKAQSGHLGMPLGMADAATVLFAKHLVFNANDPYWPNRDRFVLSAGHGSILLYSLLHLTGYAEATLEQLKSFRAFGSKTPGHPEYGHLAGVETTTGPLGQGIATAVGMALAERMLNARHGETINHHTYVIASDGDLMEGVSHEAASLAGHLGLRKLVVLYDDNGVCVDGKTELSFSENTLLRFEAYGWRAEKVDGHDLNAVDEAIVRAKSSAKPTLIACKTTIGFGSPHKAGTAEVHGGVLGKEEVIATRKALEWNYPPFEVPERILMAWRNAGKRHARAYSDWEKATPRAVKAALNGERELDLPLLFNSVRKGFFKDKPNVATRAASLVVLDAIADKLPLVGGSADLSASNNTKAKSQTPVAKSSFKGNYVYYGVREHAMGAIMNGLSLSKAFIPYGGTFLVFSDYLKPALRLSALMRQGVIYVLTHDSIGVGEDGPTHQPIEQLAHLRCVPDLLTFRPMDAMEVAECWEMALANGSNPSVLVLSRQNLPFLSDLRVNPQENQCARGAYALIDDKNPELVLMASGSEVAIAREVAKTFKARGKKVRLISVPCMELFERQPLDYRESLLNASALKVAIEAASEGVWRRYIGLDGLFVGMESFGASAPIGDLFERFGITEEAIVEKIEKRLARG